MHAEDEALHIQRMEVGSFSQGRDGLIHRKVIPFAIIVQPTHGWYEVAGPRQTARVNAGEICVVAADTPVAFAHHQLEGAMCARWLHVQATWRDLIDPVALFRTPACIRGPGAKRIGGLLGELLAADAATTLPGRLRRIALAYHVLAEALSRLPADPEADRVMAAASRLGPLLRWMRENLHRAIEVGHLARVARVSRSRLHALFAEHLRHTPMGMLMELRLAQAARLLLTTDDPLAVIAEATGFGDAFHFSRRFARRYGASPRRYRREQGLKLGME